MNTLKAYFDRQFNMMWEERSWWFNLFVAWPVLILCILFFPILWLIPSFRRNVNEMFAAVESDYNRIHENHKLDPLPARR